MTTTKTKPTASALPVLKVLDALSGYTVQGVSSTTLAKALGFNPSMVTRSIAALEEMGWARKDSETGHFHPTARMGQVFGRVLNDISKAEIHLADLKHSLTSRL